MKVKIASAGAAATAAVILGLRGARLWDPPSWLLVSAIVAAAALAAYSTIAAAVKEAKPIFPKASDYYFEPLKETFKVFDAPFRIRQDITIASTPELRRRAAAKESLTLTGTLRYQACDDQVCYRPDTIKVSWTVGLQPG